MKTLIVILFTSLFTTPILAQDCQRLKGDMVVGCEAVPRQCSFVLSCLTRRDTCVAGEIPKDSEQCTAINQCSKSISHLMSGNEKCEYKWAQTKDAEFCRVDKFFLFFEEGCPGDVGGLLSAVAYGLNAVVDQDFSCKSTTLTYDKKLKHCETMRSQFKAQCMTTGAAEDQQVYDEMAPKSCEYVEKFDQYPDGHFKVDGYSIKQFQSARNVKKVTSDELMKDEDTESSSARAH